MISRRMVATAGSFAALASGTGVLSTGLIGTAAAQAPASAPAAAAGGETTFDRIKRTRKLRIGAVSGGTPYYTKDLASGEWKGFYIDLSKALAQEVEAELEINETTWGNAVLDLQSNKLDVFFGLNPTPKRALAVDFSVPVFNNAFSFITKKGLAAESWSDLNKPEIRIAVDSGSSHDGAVTRLCPNAQILRFNSADEATMALRSGRADAQCLVIILALTVMKKVPNLGTVVTPKPTFVTTSNAGFRREADKTWRDFVNVWIDYNRGLGVVRQAIVNNMKLVGVEESDFPSGLTL
ncbi:transporter substrate-binding domain-containing protein [Roseomonas elaeocarpi]|uniref:Transporter substrate-binding domain-containing protein n=1 Tax=Roseomonas elaeocarpi TaxID=907779 RepID=A0ABV6JTE5_9PROT